MIKVYINTTFSVDHGLYGPVKDIYDLERLKFRIRTLRDICIPSVKKQTYENIEHRIFYSESIPIEIENSLKLISNSENKLILIKLKKGRQEFFDKSKTQDEKCIHMVLDDDDSLAPWFVNFIVENCKNQNKETIISYVDGIVVNWEEENLNESELKIIKCGCRMNYPMINLGLSILTFCGRGTHELGNHTKIHQNFPNLNILKITNKGKIGWIRTESSNSHHKTYHPKTLITFPYIIEKTIDEVYENSI